MPKRTKHRKVHRGRRTGMAKGVAGLGALIALVLVPFTPPGVPVLVASVAAFAGLVRKDHAS